MDWTAFLDGYRKAYSLRGNDWPIDRARSGPERDAAALAGDWLRIGNDLRAVMGRAATKPDGKPQRGGKAAHGRKKATA